MEYFRTGEVIKAGWEKFKAHKVFLWMILGVLMVSQVLFDMVNKAVKEMDFFSIIVSLITFLLTVFLTIGFTRLSLDVVDYGTEGKLGTMFVFQKIFWSYLGAYVLFFLLLTFGFLLLFIPGIYFMLKYQFFGNLIVDKNMGAIEALKTSGKITDGVKWQLFGFCLIIIGLNFLGMLALGVGLLVTIPVSVVAYTIVYRKLAARLDVVPALEAPVIAPVTTTENVAPATSTLPASGE